jgi:hypothetical protein
LPGLAVRIVSGGQTGVDRAALDVALSLGIPCGGWVPRGRRTEDGPLHGRYPMRETASEAYEVRTRFNVRDSDATLILTRGRPSGGTALTLAIARELARPCRVVVLTQPADAAAVREWITDQRVRVLNVAGPRESANPDIYADASRFLLALLQPDDSD